MTLISDDEIRRVAQELLDCEKADYRDISVDKKRASFFVRQGAKQVLKLEKWTLDELQVSNFEKWERLQDTAYRVIKAYLRTYE